MAYTRKFHVVSCSAVSDTTEKSVVSLYHSMLTCSPGIMWYSSGF